MNTDGESGEPSGAGGGRTGSSGVASLTRPRVEDANGVGLTLMLATGVLLAFGYYGARSAAEAGLGRVIPTPFYLLALALVFLVELSRTRSFDARGFARTAGVTAVYGTLVVFAIEGAGYLWSRPEAALDGYVGVTVLAVSLVVAAVAYAVYLSAAEAVDRPRTA